MRQNPLKKIVELQKQGKSVGIYSVCSANGYVIEAALKRGMSDGSCVLIESTANQCDQNGGYTGMTPADFRKFVLDIAEKNGFDKDRLFLGGDHLGPLTFAGKDEAEAMADAEELIRCYVGAGFTKIHIDTSMKVNSDDPDVRLSDEIIAGRGARLAQVAEETYKELLTREPDAIPPVYIIGSEVPIPGGAVGSEDAGVQVYGLFGDEDPIVHTRDMFAAHYRNAISFHGEHYMNDKVLLHSLIPVVQWIDDRQDGRVRPIVYISIDALRDARGAQHSSAMKAYRFLLENYTVYVVAPSPTNEPEYVAGVTAWVNDIVNVPAWNHVVFTNRKDLLYGDYLVDPSADLGAADFVGTRIVFGDDTFKTWEEIIEFFGRLGGQ